MIYYQPEEIWNDSNQFVVCGDVQPAGVRRSPLRFRSTMLRDTRCQWMSRGPELWLPPTDSVLLGPQCMLPTERFWLPVRL